MAETTTGEDKRKHLELLQAVINRMASNSFLFKGWSVTIIVATSAFAAKNSNRALLVIPVVSTLLFWAIDAYYLMLECSFRKLYDSVASRPVAKIDFGMTPPKAHVSFGTWLAMLKRPALIFFYGVVLIMVLIVLFCAQNSDWREVAIHHGS